jgi:cytochrome P450 family 135
VQLPQLLKTALGYVDDGRGGGARQLPGPRLPPIVQSLLWVFFPTRFLEAVERRYGDTFSLHFAGFPPILLTARPEEVRDLWGKSPSEIHAGEANFILKPLVGPGSLLLLDGERHHRHRRLMLPHFHGERMAAYVPTITRLAEEVVGRWPSGKAFAMQPEMQELTLQVILRTVFGMHEVGSRERLADALKRLLAFADKPWLLLLIDEHGEPRAAPLLARLGARSPLQQFRAVRQEIDRLLDVEVARLREEGARGRQDILALLVEARDEDGRGLSPEELRDEMVTLLVAGHETTATALSWACALLASNPEVQERLHARVIGGDHEYADAVAKESLRLRPILPMVGRIAKQPLELAGRHIPVGTAVAPSIYLAQRRAEDLRASRRTNSSPSAAAFVVAWARPSRSPRCASRSRSSRARCASSSSPAIAWAPSVAASPSLPPQASASSHTGDRCPPEPKLRTAAYASPRREPAARTRTWCRGRPRFGR